MNEPLTRDLVRSLTDDLHVSGAPVELTIAGGRRLRMRRRIAAGGIAAVIAAVALATAGLLTRGADRSDVIVPPHELNHAWWAKGTLHLSSGKVPVQDVQALVQIPGGVVVLTGQGVVRRIDDDGADRVIGHWREGAPRDDLHPSVRAQDDGKVVWLDGTTTPDYSFVVYDPELDTMTASHRIPTGGFHEAAYLNEFEDGVVVWDSGAYGQRAWDINSDTVTKIGTGASFLMALENHVWATWWANGTGTEVLLDGRSLWARRESPGWFSTDGTKLVTLTNTAPLRIRVRDALTGQKVTGSIELDGHPYLHSVYVGDQQLTYIAASEGPQGEVAPYDLVTCDLQGSECTPVIEGADEPPVLPSD